MGDELLEVLDDKTFTSKVHVQLGVLDSVPKTLVARVVESVLKSHECTVSILEGKSEELFRELFSHKLDLVISDFSPPSTSGQRVYARSLVKLPIAVFGSPEKYKNLKITKISCLLR
jgi:LysR family transcriptional activator of nhaA